MNISDVSNLFQFIGGLGMFLYGMQIMSNGMQKAAGSKMSNFLGAVTDRRIMGVLVGALVTAVIQSSSATTVMVVGFVNAGILNLVQATGVIMGANIGTTITAWMVSLTQLGDAVEVFKPEFFAPLLLGIGVFYVLFNTKKKDMLAAEIMIGIGLLFIGLSYMFTSVQPYSSLPIFSQVFMTLGRNPILGILAGAAVTGIIQSSSASVSILQSLAVTGAVNRSAAIYITLGQNIGTCVTALISAAGANRTAKRAAVIHLSFNVFGALLFGIVFTVINTMFPEFAQAPMSVVEISIFHTFFNITNTALLFPFANKLVELSGIIVKDKPETFADATFQKEAQEMAKRLDIRLMKSPALALQEADKEVVAMGEMVLHSLENSMRAIIEKEKKYASEVEYDEETIDQMESILSKYLVRVNNLELTEKQKAHVNNLFYTISDFERVGDHANNFAETADRMIENHVVFSETGLMDIETVFGKAYSSFENALEAFRNGSLAHVRACTNDEDEVDMLNEELREKHIDRLSEGKCEPQAGVIFLDILTGLERVSDHAVNVAGYVKDEA
ncbi:MAG: Na/Pi cotransporter family protein [Eubacteriales bacterium]|nr:Na/Pi cotransporter family protein [Eubacteriales bacterium]